MKILSNFTFLILFMITHIVFAEQGIITKCDNEMCEITQYLKEGNKEIEKISYNFYTTNTEMCDFPENTISMRDLVYFTIEINDGKYTISNVIFIYRHTN